MKRAVSNLSQQRESSCCSILPHGKGANDFETRVRRGGSPVSSAGRSPASPGTCACCLLHRPSENLSKSCQILAKSSQFFASKIQESKCKKSASKMEESKCKKSAQSASNIAFLSSSQNLLDFARFCFKNLQKSAKICKTLQNF